MSGLTWDAYVTEARRTAWPGITEDYLRLGLIGEVGEVVEVVKKSLRPGATLDVGRLVDECGDVLWYAALLDPRGFAPYFSSGWVIGKPWPDVHPSIAELVLDLAYDAGQMARVPEIDRTALRNVVVSLACVCPVPLDEAARRNVAKLRARHPNGWTTHTPDAAGPDVPE